MLKFINQFSIFKSFTTEQKAVLFKVLEKREYKKDDYIIKEEDTDKSLYLIFFGSVRIVKRVDMHEIIEIAHLHRGEYFGEFSLIDTRPRSADVLAFEETTLFQMNFLGYAELSRKFPEAEAAMLKGFLLDIIEKLRDTSDHLINKRYL